MTHEWLREYVYQIAIPRTMLSEADRALADDETSGEAVRAVGSDGGTGG